MIVFLLFNERVKGLVLFVYFFLSDEIYCVFWSFRSQS